MISQRILRKLAVSIMVLSLMVLPTAFVHGGCLGCPDITIVNPLGPNGPQTLTDFINKVITDIILPLGGMIAVLYIILAGYKMVAARGNEAKLAEAKLAFVHAGIGTAILLGAWVISQVIKTTIDSITAGS